MSSALLVLCMISALPCVLSQISLSFSAPSIVKPSQTMKLTCKVTGVPITDGSKLHAIDFIRQNAEQKLVFLAHLNYAQGSAYNPSFSSRISLSRDISKNEVYLEVRSLEREDTATYFCAGERTACKMQEMLNRFSSVKNSY
ncbi:hypothetical protein GDO81_001794 [Engystomops pustulosus]|uniref:Ig-like domain-containing protein n=1 Tax=Engystomops pustulosus TaxID=76066 RepID=A0AAV7DFN4_ENGPU|nr:hypothetical protein GDO81_001794 [Engystomops pustulosus]